MLIIEDEPRIALMIQDALEEVGATSFSFALTENEAVQMAEVQRPAVISADVQLLEGTGPAAVERIYAALGRIPAMFVTGNPDMCEPSYGCEILEKPVTLHQIQAAFERIAPAEVLQAIFKAASGPA
ncbi:CheY-like chemotaxis protein [Sphingomonas xinjiangensis]|uniref:CheY-like chemotaxis protein n=1 Tax=Sphingomonas xinjiangensis TaxID=643568 RepID=A0A840YM75_9SPHN|nr:CheY-like chemotaxis protein [Sphingomonas xinjiangensis]